MDFSIANFVLVSYVKYNFWMLQIINIWSIIENVSFFVHEMSLPYMFEDMC